MSVILTTTLFYKALIITRRKLILITLRASRVNCVTLGSSWLYKAKVKEGISGM